MGRKTGICEDNLGTADIEVVEDDGIVFDFQKVYRLNQAIEDIAKDPMHYRGVLINGVYHGESDAKGERGSFIMNAGSKLLG